LITVVLKMCKRSKLKIVVEILSIASNGVNKTKIIYSANLNFNRANEYIEEMINAGLIIVEKVNGKSIYRTSEKGRMLLRKCRELLEHIDL